MCSVSQCNRKVVAKGFCNAHYIRNKLGKDMTTPISLRFDVCTKEKCTLIHYGKGLCKKHYIKWLRQIRWEKLIELKGGKCQKCQNKYHYSVYDLHHTNKKNISFGKDICNKPFKLILKEAEDCTLLCANCHRIIHYGEI